MDEGGEIPHSVDAKLIAKYGMAMSPSSRARRKAAGFANLHYLRYDRLFLLLATQGQHRFKTEEEGNIRDVRRSRIHFGGHSIRVVRGNYLKKASPDEPAVPDEKLRVRVLIAREPYAELKAYFLENSLRWSAERFASEFMNLPYVPYAPVGGSSCPSWAGSTGVARMGGLSRCRRQPFGTSGRS